MAVSMADFMADSMADSLAQTRTAPADPLYRLAEIGTAAPGSAAEKKLAAIWEGAPGWRGWFTSVDHKTIGLRYLVTAFIFLLLGGVEALVMRV